MLAFLLIAGLGFVAPTSMAQAHGTTGSVVGRTGFTVEFRQAFGDALADAEVRVYGPTERDIVFQSGRTDRQGHFSFVPDQVGNWRIEAADAEGHIIKVPVAVTDEALVADAAEAALVEQLRQAPWLSPKFLFASLVVSGMINACALLTLWGRRKGLREKETASP